MIAGRVEAEVLVVGAGPAGAALALALARAGRDVLVLERSAFPRDKACGDCVNPGAVAELRRLGVAGRLQAKLTPQPIRGWRVEAPGGRSFQGSYAMEADVSAGEGAGGWAVRRRDFDAALLAEAVREGARVRFGTRVFDLVNRAGRVAGVVAREGTAVRELGSGFVVGADGLYSVVRRRLGLGARPPAVRKVALVGHLSGAGGGDGLGELRVDGNRICGYAPLLGGGNVTLVVSQSEVAQLSGDRREFFLGALRAFPQVMARVRERGLEPRLLAAGPFDRPVLRPWSLGAALVGDAAGYFDPFTGQGIHQALLTARLAAEAIESVLAGGADEARAFTRYARRVRRALVPKRALQRMIEVVVSRPRLMTRVVGALAEQSYSSVRLLRVTGDLSHPLTLLEPAWWVDLIYRSAFDRRC